MYSPGVYHTEGFNAMAIWLSKAGIQVLFTCVPRQQCGIPSNHEWAKN